MGRISAFIDRASAALSDFSGAMLVAMAVLINVEVVARYGFNTSTLIADEYGGYLFVWMTLLGFAHALRTGQFLRVEAVVVRLGPRGRAACDLASAMVGMGVAAIASWSSLQLFMTSWRFGTVSIQPSATPLWIAQIAVPVGLAWLTLCYADLALRAGRALSRRKT